MWAVGPLGASSPPRDTFLLADCRSRSRCSSGTFSVPMSSARGQGLGTECSLSPPPSCSNSTMSLLSPLGHQSFPFYDSDGDGEDREDEKDVIEDAHDSEANLESLRGLELQGCASVVESEHNPKEKKQVCLPESRLTPWEVWFIGKEKEERDRLQLKALEKRKEREQKINKEMEEKAAKELEKEQLQEKSKEKYHEWLKKKNAENYEKKKKEKEKEKQRQAELQEKKEAAEKKFKEWLENAKNKPCPTVKSYGYASGKLTGFYSGSSYPEPAFYNPIPWKPIHMLPPKEVKDLSGKKTKRPVVSLPHRSPSLVTHKARSNLCLGTLCRIQR
ncbi:coiled-coil domain-containing protein 34 isoform X2 [Erinaceus europaeus]|uniref:Coiled-coil domain-containing protein 34 isoform X2 n=1 Tax=Erinaceus europaeus TaxID=9365 RepID=A0ABM3W7T9_ERIEU|nr:coiled-coil domain-containing protein 34 isoform X2 [Erinaceus europaeus]